MGATIFLNDSEVGVLHELLEGDRCRLLLEIAHTAHRSMKQELKVRESVLHSILQKLELEPQNTRPPVQGAAVTD